MSFYDDASLLTICTAYKSGKLYSVKPTDGSGDFTFTRSTSATRVNEAGLIEKERENLLLQSNNFGDTNYWANTVTTTSGQSGYDGTNNAWLLETSSLGASKRVQQSISVGGVKSYSVYAKAGTANFLIIGGAVNARYFDLVNGSVGLKIGPPSPASIESVGNGWYRCTMVEVGATSVFQLYVANTDGSTLTSIGDNIYIQDAQLEAGLVATDYIETTTTTVSTGIVENVPRIDYSSGTPALLLEPQRTNLVLQSEDFGNYININSTDVSNVTISPEGFTNATSFLESATTGQHKLFTSFNFDGTSTYTFSIFAKHNGRDLFIDTQDSNEWSGRAWFDLTNGTANAILGTAAIEDFGNGWYRCIVTGISNIAGANFVELLTSDGSTNSITGDITKGVYIYGCQLEQGSYATSYIPTYGTSVTRTIDDCFLTNAQDLIGQTEGTLYCEFLKSDDSAYTIVEINLNDSTNNRLMIYVEAFNTRIQILLVTGGVQQFNDYFQYPISNRNKIALTYTNNNFKLFVNGSLEWTSTSGTLESSYNYVALRDNNLSSRQSKTVNVITFPTILTDAECITLTTI